VNRTSAFVAVLAVVCGYFVGHQHGNDVAAFEAGKAVEVVVADYPYASACSAMLEAAWEVQAAPLAGLPHNQ
jgi:hypothetical protein